MSKGTLRLALAIGVPMLLIGHGGGIPSCDLPCTHQIAESVAYDVVGDCGPSGHVIVSKPAGQCALEITGGDVGVARTGSSEGGVTFGDWHTFEGEQHCSGEAIDRDDTRVELTCQTGNAICHAFFITGSSGCDVASCNVPTCPRGEILSLGIRSCCPICIPCNTCGIHRIDASHNPPDMDSGHDDAGH